MKKSNVIQFDQSTGVLAQMRKDDIKNRFKFGAFVLLFFIGTGLIFTLAFSIAPIVRIYFGLN